MEEEYWRASKLDRENRVGACVAIGTTLVEKFVVRQVVAIKWHSIPWCTHVCKCTVHQALGSITIPAVSARFIVRVSDLHGCELAPCISRSIAGINATHFSAIFLLLEIQVSRKENGREEDGASDTSQSLSENALVHQISRNFHEGMVSSSNEKIISAALL